MIYINSISLPPLPLPPPNISTYSMIYLNNCRFPILFGNGWIDIRLIYFPDLRVNCCGLTWLKHESATRRVEISIVNEYSTNKYAWIRTYLSIAYVTITWKVNSRSNETLHYSKFGDTLTALNFRYWSRLIS